MGGAAHGFGADFASTFSDIFEDLFGVGGGRRGSRGQGREAARTCATTWKSAWRRPPPARPRKIRIPHLGDLRSLLRQRRQVRQQTDPVRHLRRRRRRACAGLLHARAHLPSLSGHGQVIENPVRPAPAPAASRASENTLSVDIPPGVEDGTRIRLAGEEARPACAAVRRAISIFSCRSPPMSSSSATAPTCTAGCQSPWWPRPSAGSSRCRPSMAARRVSRFPPAPRPAGGSAFPARACRCCARNKPAICMCR